MDRWSIFPSVTHTQSHTYVRQISYTAVASEMNRPQHNSSHPQRGRGNRGSKPMNRGAGRSTSSGHDYNVSGTSDATHHHNPRGNRGAGPQSSNRKPSFQTDSRQQQGSQPRQENYFTGPTSNVSDASGTNQRPHPNASNHHHPRGNRGAGPQSSNRTTEQSRSSFQTHRQQQGSQPRQENYFTDPDFNVSGSTGANQRPHANVPNRHHSSGSRGAGPQSSCGNTKPLLQTDQRKKKKSQPRQESDAEKAKRQERRKRDQRPKKFVAKKNSHPKTYWKQQKENRSANITLDSLFSFFRGLSKTSDDLACGSDTASEVADSVSDEESAESVSSSDSSYEHLSEDSMESKDNNQYKKKKQTFISVFWDIENCPVPSRKSAVDIVQKIRDTFYKNHREDNFYVACDIQNLSKVIEKELNESQVTVIHASSDNKNAADQKLKQLLHKFRDRYGLNDCSIVLVSSDSDFSADLHDLRYNHKIHVNLICNNNARKALQSAAEKCFYYQEFIKDLPDRRQEENLQYHLFVSNFPPGSKGRDIKERLSKQILSVNGRVAMRSDSLACITFSNVAARQRGFERLQKFEIDGHPLKVDFQSSDMNVSLNASTPKKELVKVNEPALESTALNATPTRENDTAEMKEVPEKNASPISLFEKIQGPSLLVSVTTKLGDTNYWQKDLENLIQNKDITIQTSENAECLLVKFKSVIDAEGAKVRLEKLHLEYGSLMPKVLDLIEGKPEFKLSSSKKHIKKQVENPIQEINAKKSECLNYFEKRLIEMQTSVARKENEVFVQAKLKEMNEQKVAFLYFTEKLCKEVSNADAHKIGDLLDGYDFECISFQTLLPIYAKKSSILKNVEKNQVTIIQAETGSGKSTQICQYLWREGYGNSGLIVCSQPRKIATVSLASYVSTQIGCRVGDTVGYQIGMTEVKSSETKILYVTDFTMLKMCLKDPNFNGVSCIVIDEAHERSIYTDLLLGMVKECLKTRKDLKLIISSATMETNLFTDYFKLFCPGVMQISGTTFPIEDVWFNDDVQVGWQYFDKTIEVVGSILKGKPGDVLAFLPLSMETEKAVKRLEELTKDDSFNLLIYQLHGQMEAIEQQKVFDETPQDFRKIIFATNIAETSLTIPGIRYVVDSGMVKEAYFDTVNNVSTLKVGFVSKSSAEQRRGRAGRTLCGKCYRLYSRKNYETDMPNNMVPEISRVNLGQAVLKLLLLGIKNPFEFDFIEPPSLSALLKVLQQLTHFGAIVDESKKLTELGCKMALLPLEPRLGYLIVKGIEKGIGYDALVVSALVTMSRNIFFRNMINRDEADIKKVGFCQTEGDFSTFLEIYKQWVSVPNARRNWWCTTNYINAKSMRVAHDLITELVQILQIDFNVNLTMELSDSVSTSDLLHDLIFRCYSENLCIYSGFDRLGYLNVNTGAKRRVHPSSSFYSLGKCWPQYIVYDTILNTNEPYLLSIALVKEDYLTKAVQESFLVLNLDEVKSKVIEPYKIGPFGVEVIKTLIGRKGGNLRAIEDTLTRKCDAECSVEVDSDSGYLNMFIPSSCQSLADAFVLPQINATLNRLLEREKQIGCIKGIVNSQAIIGAGAELKEIVLPGEYRDVRITAPNFNAIQVEKCLSSCGKINVIREYKEHKKVTFSHSSFAKKAFKMFENRTDFRVEPLISFESAKPSMFFKVLFHLTRRPCLGNAFFNLCLEANDVSFSHVSNAILKRRIVYRGRPLKLNLSKQCDGDFCIQNLPETVNNEELRLEVQSHLPVNIQLGKLIVVRKKEPASSNQEIDDVKFCLVQMFSDFTRGHIQVDLKTPKPFDWYWQAVVYLDNAHDGQNAVSIIKSRIARSQGVETRIVELKPLLETEMYCTKHIFNAIKEQIAEALKFFNDGSNKGDKLDIIVVPSGESDVVIKISSNNIADITDSKKAIEKCIQGEKIEHGVEALFTEKGKAFLRGLNVPNSHVVFNRGRKTINIFGSESSCSQLKYHINNYLDKVEKVTYTEIKLKPSHSRKSAIKEVLQKYGHDLEKLKNEFQVTNVKINVYKHVLYVAGDKNSVEQCQKQITALCEELNEEDNDTAPTTSEEICPVCCEEVTDPFYRLEYCGHGYCKACLLFQLESSDEIPVTCCKLDCGKPITCLDLQWAITGNRPLEVKVHERAFESFIKKSPDLKYCPTPDCTMIYRVCSEGENPKSICPSCKNTICTRCGILYHEGTTCDFYGHLTNEKYSLQEWLRADPANHKLCPQCSTPIEKNGGCLHMVCWKCRSHMCWLCMKIFAEGNEVHLHQPHCAGRLY